MLCMPIAGEVVAQELGGGEDGADGPDAGGVGGGANAGAGVLGGGGAGGTHFWRVQGVGAGEWGGVSGGVEDFGKLMEATASHGLRSDCLAASHYENLLSAIRFQTINLIAWPI